jgi:hypothetical protein
MASSNQPGTVRRSRPRTDETPTWPTSMPSIGAVTLTYRNDAMEGYRDRSEVAASGTVPASSASHARSGHVNRVRAFGRPCSATASRWRSIKISASFHHDSRRDSLSSVQTLQVRAHNTVLAPTGRENRPGGPIDSRAPGAGPPPLASGMRTVPTGSCKRITATAASKDPGNSRSPRAGPEGISSLQVHCRKSCCYGWSCPSRLGSNHPNLH